MVRCVNLDWLEVYCIERSGGMSANDFRQAGIQVDERDYGTRIYHSMFTLFDSDANPLLEVRRLPKNPLMPAGSCHIRLVNATCYRDDAVQVLQEFLVRFNYTLINVSRVDICLDLILFDDNTRPRVFIQRYMRGKFSKLNQANIHAHGSDRWTGRVWNSVSWGSPSSPISTKFYNKTLELYDPITDSYGKPHIRWSWLQCGLIDDFNRCTLNDVTQEIWRVEFSIKSAVKNWVTIELNGDAKRYYSIRNSLEMYDSRDKLLTMFASLSEHYFHFKRYMMGVRKDKCPDRMLFRWKGEQKVIKVEHADMVSARTPDPILLQLIKKLKLYIDTGHHSDAKQQCTKLLHLLEQYATYEQQSKPWSREQRLAMQLLISRRAQGDQSESYSALLREIADLLHINPKAAPF